MIERRPLWPPWLPRSRTRTAPRSRATSSTTTTRSAGQRRALGQEPLDRDPAAVHEGERLHEEHRLAAHLRLRHPGLVFLVARAPAERAGASASTTMNPTLCRVRR